MSVGAVNKQTGERIPTAGMPAVDSVLSGSSTNPVQNRVVKAALDEKADTDIVASDFDATASYTAGNYCIYEGRFYKFKANHSGAWSAADVDEIKIAGELSALKSGLIVDRYQPLQVNVNETFQLSNDVLKHNIIILSMFRYGYGGSVVLQKEILDSGSYYGGCGIYVSNSIYVYFTVSSTGLVTITNISWSEPGIALNVLVNGIF